MVYFKYMMNSSRLLAAFLILCAFFGVSVFCFLNSPTHDMSGMTASSMNITDHLAMWKSIATALIQGTILALLTFLGAYIFSTGGRLFPPIKHFSGGSLVRHAKKKEPNPFHQLKHALSQGIVHTKRWGLCRPFPF